MAVSKVILNGNTLIDTTDKTVTSGGMLSGVTALKNDGTSITGSIATKTSSDLTASGATVTAPAGYYASSASKSVSSGSATTPATSITANPSISVSSGGLITASVSTSKSVTPTVSAGYVSSGTAGTVSVSGSNTSQLTAQAAQTIHPSTSDQTIASGKYLTGTQTVLGVLLSNLSAGNIKKDVVVKVGDAADDDCVTSVTGTYEGGGGLESETGTWTLTEDTNDATISFANVHTSAPFHVLLCDNQTTGFNENDVAVQVIDSYTNTYSKGSNYRAGIIAHVYATSTGMSGASSQLTDSDLNNRLTSTGFHAYYNSTTRFFRSGHTYKWIAVWQPTV